MSDPEHLSTDGDREPEESTADTVVVSYPSDFSTWGRDQLEKRSYRAYLRRTRDRPRVGDVWEEFVDVGCCGNALDVALRVERVEGGTRMGPDTEIVYESRDDGSVEGGWRVQSADGPVR